MTYTFNEKKHVHMLDNRPLTGTTTVFGVLSKPWLTPWAVDLAVDSIIDFAEVERPGEMLYSMVRDELLEKCEIARTLHTMRRDAGGKEGTKIHEDIEKWIKYRLEHERMRDLPEMETKQGKLFVAWALENVDHFLFSEMNVYSSEHWVGGIIDFGYMGRDGKQYIGDIKTSKGIYPEQFWQCAAYHMQLMENGGFTEDGKKIYTQDKPVDGYTIVNLPKAGGINVETSYGFEDNLQAFFACLTIYRMREKLNAALGK